MKTRILVVDDAAAMRAALKAFLKSEGYDVIGELGSAGGVLELVKASNPDIVCLDYHLPDGNGIEVMRALHAEFPTLAVLMITGDAGPELEAEAAEAGAAGFIRKPLSQERMSQEIRQVVFAQRLHRRQADTTPFAVNQARARAVIADDSATMRSLLTAILTHARVEVVGQAPDGRQAAEMAARSKPELVCLDMDMPVMNGLEALDQIRVQSPGSRVLMITGKSGKETVMQAARRGAAGYILKPFEPDKVIEAVDRLLGGAGPVS